jgi:dTDP-4-dehydrorhamnose 3,5-epimerase-like enzyme
VGRVDECSFVKLPVVEDRQGNLAFAETERHVPFPIGRVFYVYGVPEDARRGGHAHKALEQAVFCLSGRLTAEVDDGSRRRSITLDDPLTGLYLAPMVWHDLTRFEAGTVYLVLASDSYDESDYIRDYEDYLAAIREPEVAI